MSLSLLPLPPILSYVRDTGLAKPTFRFHHLEVFCITTEAKHAIRVKHSMDHDSEHKNKEDPSEHYLRELRRNGMECNSAHICPRYQFLSFYQASSVMKIWGRALTNNLQSQTYLRARKLIKSCMLLALGGFRQSSPLPSD